MRSAWGWRSPHQWTLKPSAYGGLSGERTAPIAGAFPSTGQSQTVAAVSAYRRGLLGSRNLPHPSWNCSPFCCAAVLYLSQYYFGRDSVPSGRSEIGAKPSTSSLMAHIKTSLPYLGRLFWCIFELRAWVLTNIFVWRDRQPQLPSIFLCHLYRAPIDPPNGPDAAHT